MDGILDALSNIPAGNISLGAISAAFVYALLRGSLFTRQHLDDLRRMYESRIESEVKEKESWKAAWMASEDARKVEARQKDELLEQGKLTNQMLQTLKEERGRS